MKLNLQKKKSKPTKAASFVRFYITKSIGFGSCKLASVLIICHLNHICLSPYTGGNKGTEARHLDGGSCHCHIWSLLGNRPTCLRPTVLHIRRHRCRVNRNFWRHDSVQFCCQPVCVRSVEPTIQGQDEENDLLFLSRQGSSRASGHPAYGHHPSTDHGKELHAVMSR